MSQCQILTYDTSVFPPNQVYIPISQIYYDSVLELVVVDNTPINPTDIINKSYADSLATKQMLTLASSVIPVTAGTSYTDFQSFTAIANTLTQPGDKLVYSSNVNITSADNLEFFIGSNAIVTYTAGGLLSSSFAKVEFEINYIDSSHATWSVVIVSSGQTFAAGGMIGATPGQIDWTSNTVIKTSGKDNSLTGTLVGYSAILTKIPG